MVAGNGSACVVLFQAGKVKENQRIFWNSGCASMGYDLPAAIGACFANDKKDVVCLAGDGSLQMNIQELQTVAYHQLPIKLFVLNNNGYVSIRQTQDSFFDARYVGCDSHSGVSFPDTVKIAQAYGLATEIIDSHHDLKGKIGRILDKPGPVVCDVRLSADYKFEPKLSSERKPDGRIVSKPLEDMYPFLDREEFKENMLVEEWQQGEKG
jgi:acetolactate synthase-1/2/3 large subunit